MRLRCSHRIRLTRTGCSFTPVCIGQPRLWVSASRMFDDSPRGFVFRFQISLTAPRNVNAARVQAMFFSVLFLRGPVWMGSMLSRSVRLPLPRRCNLPAFGTVPELADASTFLGANQIVDVWSVTCPKCSADTCQHRLCWMYVETGFLNRTKKRAHRSCTAWASKPYSPRSSLRRPVCAARVCFASPGGGAFASIGAPVASPTHTHTHTVAQQPVGSQPAATLHLPALSAYPTIDTTESGAADTPPMCPPFSEHV
jgi:hypothetical protein